MATVVAEHIDEELAINATLLNKVKRVIAIASDGSMVEALRDLEEVIESRNRELRQLSTPASCSEMESRDDDVPTSCSFPDTVLPLIAGHLSTVADRVRVSSVCRHWRRLLYKWPTVVELRVDGNGPPTEEPVERMTSQFYLNDTIINVDEVAFHSLFAFSIDRFSRLAIIRFMDRCNPQLIHFDDFFTIERHLSPMLRELHWDILPPRYLTDFGSVPISYGPAPAWFLRMLSFRALDRLMLGGFDAFSNGHLNKAMQGTHLTKLFTHGDLDTDDFASLCRILAPHLKCLKHPMIVDQLAAIATLTELRELTFLFTTIEQLARVPHVGVLRRLEKLESLELFSLSNCALCLPQCAAIINEALSPSVRNLVMRVHCPRLASNGKIDVANVISIVRGMNNKRPYPLHLRIVDLELETEEPEHPECEHMNIPDVTEHQHHWDTEARHVRRETGYDVESERRELRRPITVNSQLTLSWGAHLAWNEE